MPEDETAAPEADEQPTDPTMEVAGAEAVSDPAATEVGTAVVPDSTPDPFDNPGDDEEEEKFVSSDQASYVTPSALSQAEYVQGLMVAGSTAGQDERRKTLARNRETRAQQHLSLERTNRPDNAQG